MNFLIAILQSLLFLGFVWGVYWCVPEKLWALLPEPISTYRKQVISLLSITVVTIIMFGSFSAYGPRIGLSSNSTAPTPQHQEVEVGAKLVEFEDKRGRFEDKINSEPVED